MHLGLEDLNCGDQATTEIREVFIEIASVNASYEDICILSFTSRVRALSLNWSLNPSKRTYVYSNAMDKKNRLALRIFWTGEVYIFHRRQVTEYFEAEERLTCSWWSMCKKV